MLSYFRLKKSFDHFVFLIESDMLMVAKKMFFNIMKKLYEVCSAYPATILIVRRTVSNDWNFFQIVDRRSLMAVICLFIAACWYKFDRYIDFFKIFRNLKKTKRLDEVIIKVSKCYVKFERYFWIFELRCPTSVMLT